jgi:hypothetical protein
MSKKEVDDEIASSLQLSDQRIILFQNLDRTLS